MKDLKEFNKDRKKILSYINNIISDERTKKISYLDAKEQFDYVQNIFAEINIKDANIYISPHSLMKVNGFGHSAGFYSYDLKSIVIGDNLLYQKNSEKIVAKVNTDEVIVHELLHYGRHNYFKYNWDIMLEEDFAYGYSIDYFLEKGYSYEDIIKNYLSPYLATIYYKMKNKNKTLDDFIYEKGIEFIASNKGKSKFEFKNNKIDRNDLIDF